MKNYRATPLSPATNEQIEVTQGQEPEVIIVSWDIHEDELPKKQDDKGKKELDCLQNTISGQ